MSKGIQPRYVLFGVLVLLIGMTGTAAARKWSDDSSTYSIEADFVAVTGDKVQLKKTDGLIIEVPLSRLSAADRQFIDAHRAPPAVDPFNTAAAKTTPAPGGDHKEVVATGYGLTPDDAFKSALSTAIEQAVGLFVDAQTVIQNDEIIKNQILTASAAYIDRYDVIKRDQDGALHRCRLVARVKLRQLQQAISDTKAAVNSISGKDLAVALSTVEKSDADTAAILVDLIRSFPAKVLFAKVNGPSKALPGNDESNAKLRIPVMLGVDLDAYTLHLKEVAYRADKLSIAKFVSRGKLAQQKPISRDVPITEYNWEPLQLFIPAQKDLETVIFPACNVLAPDRWFAAYDLSFPYSSSLRNYNSNGRDRDLALMNEANTALDGGIDQVMALQEKRQELLAALVLVELGASGNITVSTYAFSQAALADFKYHVAAKVTLEVSLNDASGAALETTDVVANMDEQQERYLFGFVHSTFRFFGNGVKTVPKAVMILPGLRFGDMYRSNRDRGLVDPTNYVTLVTQYYGHLYVDLTRDDLKQLTDVKLKAKWSADRFWRN